MFHTPTTRGRNSATVTSCHWKNQSEEIFNSSGSRSPVEELPERSEQRRFTLEGGRVQWTSGDHRLRWFTPLTWVTMFSKPNRFVSNGRVEMKLYSAFLSCSWRASMTFVFLGFVSLEARGVWQLVSRCEHLLDQLCAIWKMSPVSCISPARRQTPTLFPGRKYLLYLRASFINRQRGLSGEVLWHLVIKKEWMEVAAWHCLTL